MDANNSWWVGELLAADCEKVVAPCWMGRFFVQTCCEWLCEMMKKDEAKRTEEEHREKLKRRS